MRNVQEVISRMLLTIPEDLFDHDIAALKQELRGVILMANYTPPEAQHWLWAKAAKVVCRHLHAINMYDGPCAERWAPDFWKEWLEDTKAAKYYEAVAAEEG